MSNPREQRYEISGLAMDRGTFEAIRELAKAKISEYLAEIEEGAIGSTGITILKVRIDTLLEFAELSMIDLKDED